MGGWGALLEYNGSEKELYGGTRNTTNNIMELTSAIEGLKAIKNKTIPVEVVMDSQYVVKGINEWVNGWLKNNWKTSKKTPVENRELWQNLLDLKKQFSDIKFQQVLGHNGHPGNEKADSLANKAMDEIEKTN